MEKEICWLINGTSINEVSFRVVLVDDVPDNAVYRGKDSGSGIDVYNTFESIDYDFRSVKSLDN